MGRERLDCVATNSPLNTDEDAGSEQQYLLGKGQKKEIRRFRTCYLMFVTS